MNEEEIFNEAISLSGPQERAAFLERACAGNPALRASVDALLEANVGASGFLNAPAPGLAATLNVTAIRESPGAIIGCYKLLQQLGEGGMGVVFMAEQQEPIRRRVALKIIKPGMDTRQVIARFEAERQALAVMDHPNIARVLDAGTTESGRPFFVMELVRGVPITQYCDERRLTPEQRLELFVPICQAVQHAHQKGIIHRDIKPSNVLIAEYDEKPSAKIIDFGVAKAIGERLTEKSLFTQFGQVVGTVEYMSPEQAKLNELDIDTRTDVYSLGVLLYELLAGSPPFTKMDLEKAGMLEMLRVIREQEPSKPSTKLSTAAGLPTLAANRGTEPAKLTKLVRGELDWIVMKALEKDRNRRYETANGFAMDVQRYLAEQPVTARPPTTSYLLRKFVRRNKATVVMAAVVAGLLVVATAISMGLAFWALSAQRLADDRFREADAARHAARQEAVRAKTEAAKAVAISDFLRSDLLGQAFLPIYNRYLEPPSELRLVTVLNRAAEKLEGRFADQPLVEAALQHTIGTAYGNDPRAIAAFRRAALLRNTHLGPEHPDTLESLACLAYRTDDVGLSQRVLDTRYRLLGEENRATLNSRFLLAILSREHGQEERAVSLLRENLAIERRVYGDDDDQTHWTRHTLADTLEVAAENGHAKVSDVEIEGLYRRALGTYRGKLTTSSRSEIAFRFGRFLRSRGRFDEAEAVLREAYDQLAKMSGSPPDYVATIAGELEQLYRIWNKPEQEAQWQRKRMAGVLMGNRLADSSDEVAYRTLADLFAATGQIALAEKAFRAAIELSESSAPNESSWATHHNFGDLLRGQNRFGEAEREYRESIRLNRKWPYSYGHLGDMLCFNVGDYRGALPVIQEATRLQPSFARWWYVLGSARAFGGQWPEAAAAYRKSAELDPKDDFGAIRFAIASLHIGDQKGYQLGCEMMLKRFADTKNPITADTVARICLLSSTGADVCRQAIVLANQNLEGAEKHDKYPWFLATKALADHRDGRHTDAVRTLRGITTGEGNLAAIVHAERSMALLDLGETAQARAELAKAQKILADQLPNPERGQAFGDDWHNWLQPVILCREAEGRLIASSRKEREPSKREGDSK
jgi:serine/threonine protein kinase/tetratricopeptide (TPR) repeat protein